MSFYLISTTELSKVLGITTRAVCKNIENGNLKAQKRGHRYEIFIDSLDLATQVKIKEYYTSQQENDIEREYSEEEKKLALTKFDLVMEWRKFLLLYEGKKTNSVKDFMAIYKKFPTSGVVYARFNNVSYSSMDRWNKALLKSGDDWHSLLNKYVPNTQGKQLSKEEQEVFMGLLLHPNKTNIAKAIKLTKHILSERGIKDFRSDMSYRRFAKKYISEHYDLWVLSREGTKSLRDKVIPYIQRDVSKLEVGDVIVGDGHRLAFQVINPFNGKPCRPMLVAYQDWKSGALVGFEIMLEENTQCIASALRNSILNLGKIPKYVYQDNGKAFKSKYFVDNDGGITGLFVKLGITPIFALPYNAKAKVIERFFREMQDSFERLLPSFVGANIMDKPAYLKRNEKFHKEQHNQYIPTMKEVVDLINRWLCFHYSQPCPNVEDKTIGEVLESGKGFGVDISKLDDLMMATQIKNIGRNGIRFLKSDYYDESLYGLRMQVVIKYSLFDLSQIKVYTTQGKFLCVAKRLESIHPLANYLGEAKDIEEFRQRLKQQKKLEMKTVKKYLSELKQKNIPLEIEDFEEDFDDEAEYLEEKFLEKQELYLERFEQGKEVEDEEPIFHNKYEKYDYLVKKKYPKIEEIEWMQNYECSEEYKLIYGVYEG